MPDLLNADEAAHVAAYLLLTTLEPPPPPRAPTFLPTLQRAVTYQEVRREVFSHTCIHCHSDGQGDLMPGESGPGNSGGFGFAPRGINLTDERGARAAAHLLGPALRARHLEASGQRRPDAPRGMPLGLPPITPTQLQLVETWASQTPKP
jgi:hypothetical protein